MSEDPRNVPVEEDEDWPPPDDQGASESMAALVQVHVIAGEPLRQRSERELEAWRELEG